LQKTEQTVTEGTQDNMATANNFMIICTFGCFLHIKRAPFNVRIWNPLLFETQNNKITINELLLEKKIETEQDSFLFSQVGH